MHQWVCAGVVGNGNGFLFLFFCIFRLSYSGEVWKLYSKSSVLKWGREELGLQNAYPKESLGFSIQQAPVPTSWGATAASWPWRPSLLVKTSSSLQLLEELPASCHLPSVSFLPTATSSWKVWSPSSEAVTKILDSLTPTTYVKTGDHSVIQY